jgi:hypothetical protein
MHALADELVDLDKIESNDIFAILTTYGVEAARAAVIQEVSSVFGAYAIAVDYRHLTIIADYMVRRDSTPLLTADPRRWIQTIQSNRYLQQIVSSSQGLV